MEACALGSFMSIGLFSSFSSSNSDMVCFVRGCGYLYWMYGVLLWILATLVLITEARNIIRCSVEEEVPVGTVIVDIFEESRLREDHANSPAVINSLSFGFLKETEWNFSIDAKSGILRSSGRIDRESFIDCAGKDICEITLDVAVQPVQYFKIIKIVIEIHDINDNGPIFPEQEMTHPILESALPGSSFVISTATDLDSPLFGVKRYELESDNDIFGITQREQLDGAFDLRLVVQHTLDREERHQYRIKITAFDGGNPSNAGFMSIIIPVMDSNDNHPVFDNDTYRVSVSENVPVGTTIVRIHASDQDVGQNGRILYGFSPMTHGLYGDVLDINQETGDIYVRAALDREKTDVCNLIVTAKDQGPDSLPADATVVLSIADVNDNAPDITVNTLGASQDNKARISEDAVIGTFVAHVSVADPDVAMNGQLNCSLNDYTFALKPTDYTAEYQIETARTLDRETIPQYGLEIVCRDRGRPPQVAIKRITVIVLDVNDNAPIFSKKNYIEKIQENDFIEIRVTNAIATDRDMGPNGEVTYSLSGETTAFEIDSHTGAISTKTTIDREKVPKYLFQVIAMDHGQPPRSATAHVSVTVEDKNDEIPEFTQPKFTFHVDENAAERTTVGKVYAKDEDAPPNNEFIYSFVDISSSLPFSIDTLTGYILTRRPLDRETQHVYNFVVRASDHETPPKSSTASVTIFVDDINDNVPLFDFPNPRNNTVTISNKVPVGSKVTQISAHDPDMDMNARVEYTILGGNEDGIFILLPDNGAIEITVPVTNKEYANYVLRIQAKDHGAGGLKSEADLRIVVNSSIPYPPGQSALKSSAFHYNVIVVVAVACGGAVITVSLIVGILLVRSQGRKRRVHKYNCRMEAKRMLTSKEIQSSAPEESIPMKNGPQNDGGLEIAKSLSQMDSHPCISGICPQTPIIQLHPKPWCTAASGVQRDMPHGSRGPPRVGMTGHSISEQDKTSDHSGDGSQTDSGRGGSEEGEMKHRIPHHGLPHHGVGHYATHGHAKLPSVRRDHHAYHNVNTMPPSSTIQLRPGNHAYPPPPPPPNRLRTFSPEGHMKKSPDKNAPSSVVYPSGMDYTKPVRHVVRQSPASIAKHSGNHNNLNHNTDPGDLDDPWQQQGAVIGESMIV